MKQILLKTILLLCLAVVGGNAWADEYSYTFQAKQFSSNGAKTLNDVSWTLSGNGNYLGYDGTKGQQFGSGSSPYKTLSLNTSDISGTITKIVVNASTASSASATISCTVGGSDFGTQAQSLSTSATNYTFSGSASGEIVISMSQTTSKALYIKSITIIYTPGGGGDTSTLDDCDLALTGDPVELEFDLYDNADAQVISYTTSSTGAVTIDDSEYATFDIDENNKTITVTPTAKTSDEVTITVNQAADDTYAAGSTTFTITIDDSAPKTYSWALTDFDDLVEGDVFVIVGDNGNTYAMSNNNGTGSAPSVVAVTIENDEITSDVADNIKWNISGDANNGYTFYPNGDTEKWLYCTNTNNGVRVGTNSDNTFTLDGGYLNHVGTSRYVGIYNSQDWRCYTSTTGNISGQSFAFYKYVNSASVKNPVITVEETFIGSTTATITCATQGATIYYSYGQPVWEEYTEPLNITETTTIYAKAVKDSDESSIVSKTTTKVLPTPTVTIDATGITNTNVFDGTEAGNLAATVTYNDAAVEGATVTWSGNNDEVATIDATTGAVTLVGAGSVTFTATYAGNSDYAEKTATYEMTVTNIDPNAPGTENNPYSVAEAIAATPTTGEVYIHGYVSSFYNTSIVGDGSNYRYYISDDGTTTTQLLVYKGKGLNETSFTNADDLKIGDEVVIYGKLTMYQNAPEVASGNYLVSWQRVEKPATPTFSPEAGTYTAVQSVTLSTTTDGATIYYTIDGTEPTTESTQYIEPIEVNTTTTIKAIAVKDNVSSLVAEATFTIDLTPSIVFDGIENPLNVSYIADDTNIHYVASNTTGTITLVVCDAQGNPTTYDWFSAEITSNVYVHVTLEANEDAENTRTAYFKLIADNVESAILAITQAKFVPDYATLPFEYNDGKQYLPTGLTGFGLGTDYNGNNAPNTKLKFDGSGDELILKINEAATVLSFNIKGNGYSDGTFKVQTSADGTDYDDLETYTELSESKEKFLLNENVRYIKWIYTNKSSGNVGLGNIKVEKRMGDATVTLASACNDGEGNYYGTYSSVTGFVVPDGLTVTEVGIDDEKKLIVEPYETGDIVPAHTGVMVSSTTDGAHDLVLSTGGESVLGTDNRLRATGDNGVTAADMEGADDDCVFYRLTMHNGQEIGYWWGAEGGAGFALAANKAYLAVPNSANPVKGFSFFDGDDSTAINSISTDETAGAVYDLQGRRISVASVLPKGVYIVNGKKVIIK